MLINYTVGKRYEKAPDAEDLALIARIAETEHPLSTLPHGRMPDGDEARRNDDIGLTHVYHFHTHRNLEFSLLLSNPARRCHTSRTRLLLSPCR